MEKKITCLVIVLLAFSGNPLHAQTCDTYVGGYIPSWRDPGAVDYTKLTHSFYAFAATNLDGDIILDNEPVFNSFKTASATAQRFLSLAGGGGDASFSSMTASSSAIQAFANNCVAFCQTHNLHGIDVDWEGIITVQDSVKYGALMRALATALHANGLQLIATLSFGSYGGDHYNVGALKKADWIQLMVYDQTGTWNESPYGNHASYQQMIDAIHYWTGRGYTDVSKMVIGLPFYGYRFNSTAGGLATALTYSEIIGAHPNLACDQDEVNLTVFNSPETIRKKVAYVKTNGLKGVMIWEMGQDINSAEEKSLLKAISLATCDLLAACNSLVTGLPAESDQGQIWLMINPVDNILQVSLQDLVDGVSKMDLIDNLGRVLFSKERSFSETIEEINVSKEAPGIYYLRITHLSQRVTIKRVVKL